MRMLFFGLVQNMLDMTYFKNVVGLTLLMLLFTVISCKTGTFNANHSGAFRLEDGRLISIRKSEGRTLRYRVFHNGDTGRLYPRSSNGYSSGPGFNGKIPIVLEVTYMVGRSAKPDSIIWKEDSGHTIRGWRVNRDKEVIIRNGDIRLYGRLTIPDGNGPFPAVVLVHGSGNDKATDYYYNGDFYAAHGIAALTYDKRGTGSSNGTYTFDYYKLAGDVAAAVAYLGSRPEIEPSAIGLSGYSQGGWVAPLAASLCSDIQYVIVNYGIIESAIEEAEMETIHSLKAKGIRGQDLQEARELIRACIEVVAQDFNKGWEKVDQLKRKYRHAPWRDALKGTTVHTFLKYPRWLIKILGPRKAPPELDWYYTSAPLLDTLDTPMAWLLGESDMHAPPEKTIPKLQEYERRGKIISTMIFSNTDHSMLLFKQKEGQLREYTRYHPAYFRTEVDYALKLARQQKLLVR